MSFGQAGQDFGSAVGDLFASVGQHEAEQGYQEAAQYEVNNEKIATAAGAIKQAQAGRQIYMATSGEQAAQGASGVRAGGSGGDILASTAQQGALAKASISAQTELNVNDYTAKAAADYSLASQAKNQALADQVKAATDTASGVLSIFSV